MSNDCNHRGGLHGPESAPTPTPILLSELGSQAKEELTGQLKAHQTLLAGLQSDPRAVYFTVNCSHNTLSGQTTMSLFSASAAAEPA